METYEDPDKVYRYEYQAENESLVDRWILKHWWKLTIRLIPLKMPANLVSMIGNLGSWFSFLVLSGVLFGPLSRVSREKPWLFGLAALGLLLYQTLDALDGIQARRTGQSGPLGEFVDHFFDSFNVFLLPLGFTLAFFDVPSWLSLFIVFLAVIFDWAELRRVKETSTIHFGKLSSEEAQLFLILFYVLVWLTGYSFWATPLTALNLSPVLLMLCVLVPTGFALGLNPLIAFRFKWMDEILAETATLAPIAVWTLVMEGKTGRAALVVGAVLLGFSGSRFAGDLLRSRLLGVKNPHWYADMLILDLFLVLSFSLGFIPAWLSFLVAAIYLAWVLAMLGLQFQRAVARVHDCLGMGLFSAPVGSKKTSTG